MQLLLGMNHHPALTTGQINGHRVDRVTDGLKHPLGGPLVETHLPHGCFSSSPRSLGQFHSSFAIHCQHPHPCAQDHSYSNETKEDTSQQKFASSIIRHLHLHRRRDDSTGVEQTEISPDLSAMIAHPAIAAPVAAAVHRAGATPVLQMAAPSTGPAASLEPKPAAACIHMGLWLSILDEIIITSGLSLLIIRRMSVICWVSNIGF